MKTTTHGSKDCVRAWDLVVHAQDVGLWRNRVAAVVAALGGDARAVSLVRLGVSELLTNVVKHVQEDRRCQLVVQLDGDCCRVRVLDGSLRAPAVTVPDRDAEAGRGLWLLRELADNLGYELVPGGKWVWFTAPLTSTPVRGEE